MMMMIEYIVLLAVGVAGVCGIIITKNVFGSDQQKTNRKIKQDEAKYHH